MSIPLELCYTSVMSNRIHFEYPELNSPIDLIVHTKSPHKWLLIDRETGQVYEGSEFGWWNRLDPNPVPPVGFEPTAYGLKVRSSTAEL